MAVVSDPHTGPLHARVKELWAEGVTVCLGQDDVSDACYPFGRNNMLEVAFLAAHLLWMTKNRELVTLYDMITLNAAQAMNVKDHQLIVGASANLVVLNAPNVLEALREHTAPLMSSPVEFWLIAPGWSLSPKPENGNSSWRWLICFWIVKVFMDP